MTTNTNKVFIWLQEFKSNWLPVNISNNNRLIQLITDKLCELEQLLIPLENNQNVVLIEDNHQNTKSSDAEQFVLSINQDHLSVTLPNVDNQVDNENYFHHPTIRIKRIPLTDAKRFMPPAWKTIQSKNGQRKSKKKLSINKSNGTKNKKNNQTNKLLLSLSHNESIGEDGNKSNSKEKLPRSKSNLQHPSTSSLASIQSINDGNRRSKRKLRAIDAEDDDLYTLGNLSQMENPKNYTECEQIPRYIGQNGILSQTRKTNETTTTTNYDDFTIRLSSRQVNKEEIISTKHLKTSNDTHTINSTISETSINEVIPIDEDGGPIDDEPILQEVIETNDADSLFASLDMTYDKTLETNPILNNNSIINYNDCIEDISNDGIEPPPSSSSPNTTGQCSLTT